MDMKVATPWKCHGCNKMSFHGNTRLTCTKCSPGDRLETSMVMQVDTGGESMRLRICRISLNHFHLAYVIA